MKDRLEKLLNQAFEHLLETGEPFSHKNYADLLISYGVIVPPCKVGDRIYYIDSTNFIDCEVVKQISFNHHGKWLVLLDHSCISFDEIGKTVFLTREEAEQALKGAQGK